MSFVKSLIGSLLGAAVGVAVHFGIQKTTGQSYIWFPLVIGVLTGVVARMLAGRAPSNFGRYANGALAGLIAGVAILGIEFIPTLLAEKPDFGPIKGRVSAPVDRKSADDTKSSSEDRTDADSPADEATEADADSTTEMDADDAATNDQIGNTSQEDSNDLDKDKVDPTADDDSPDPDDERGDSAKPDNPMDMMKRDRTAGPDGPNHAAANTKLFTERIKKQDHQSWYNFLLPHVFTGLGMLIAYQLVRGFGSSGPKK